MIATTTMRRRFSRMLRAGIVLVVFVAGLALGALGYYELAPPGKTCLSCHEIADAYSRWEMSAHQQVPCKACHGGALSSGLHGMARSVERAVSHVTVRDLGSIRLDQDDVDAMTERCASCHAEEYGDWSGAGHAVTYEAIFLDEEQNRAEKPGDDCLRCHGMFFEGDIADLVTPTDTGRPWSLLRPELSDRAAIPCLACHRIHAGEPGEVRGEEESDDSPEPQEDRGPAVHLYSRNERMSFPVSVLPVPVMESSGGAVVVSPDPRQRLCVQCHAPGPFHRLGSSDDRTPAGVHEGLSCMACHRAHSADTRSSCANCHPGLSNCGVDVTTMDTSFRSVDSPHDIHIVACTDCHPDGRPPRPGD